jgi:hypothetical protein
MRFQPKQENELSRLLPDGEYGFEILDATDEVSKNNNEMIKLKIALYDGEDVGAYAFDYLMESVAYKLRHCSIACGLLPQYESGELVANMFIGKIGQVKVIVQKDKTGQYPDKNVIKDYVTENVKQQPARASQATRPSAGVPTGDNPPPHTDDDLPF